MKKTLLQVLLMLLFCMSARAQTRQLTGKVMGKGNEALIGVTVKIKNTGIGAATDLNGAFKLSIPATGNVTLVLTYIGYKSQEVTVSNQKELVITLQEDASKMLNEVTVVNIGYSSVSRNALTGSVSSVTAKDLKDFPVGTAAEALAGKLAGVSVTTTEGTPGASILVRVRGGGSITGDNSPLYIVDGVQVENALSVISPQEIQSIDVLKDIASTAIYGARGANGVVLITTKSGTNSPAKVSLSSYLGVRQITRELDVMKPYDFVMYQYQLYNNNTDQPTKDAFTQSYGTFDDIGIYKNYPFINWQDRIFGRNALTQSETINISGGTKTTSYNFTANNLKEDGIQLNSGNQRTFAAFRFDNKVSDKFKFGFSTRYSRQQIIGVGTSSTGSQSSNRLRNSVRFRPFEAPGLQTQIDQFDPNYANLTNLTSPILGVYAETKNNYINQLITSVNAQYTILPHLTLSSIVGITTTDNRIDMFSNPTTSIARQYGNLPVVDLSTGSTVTLTNSNTINYNFTLGRYHNLTLLAGEEVNQSDSRNLAMEIKWMPADITPTQAFAGIQKTTPPSGSVQDAPTTSETGTRLFSLFARASYSYKDKYLANFIIRRDGSSLFSPENQYAFFPSGQLAWRVTEEPFMKKMNLTWLDNFKIRASYGEGGNNRIGVDLYKTLFTAGSKTGYAIASSVTPGFAPNAFANPNIKWETTISRNLGLDFGVFNGRISGSVDVYKNNTSGLLLQQQIPPTSGYTSQIQNIGSTSNQGVEIQLNGIVVNTKNFSYNASFNLTFNRNKIVSLGNDLYGNPKSSYLVASGGINGSDFIAQVGGPVGQFYGYVSDGRYELSDFVSTYHSSTNSYTYLLKPGVTNDASVALGAHYPQPGDMKLKKLSTTGDSTITAADQQVLGISQPKFYGGFSQQFSYKNFDLSIFMNFSYGNKEYNANRTEFTGQYLYKDNNMLSVVANRWQMFDNAGNKVTDPVQLAAMNANTTFWTPPSGNYILTSYAIEDGSFLRINNITLGYSLPKSLLDRTKVFSKFRIYATVNNVYTFTKYTGYDPEASTRNGNPLTPGVDYAAYPRNRFILAGIDLSF